MRWQEMMFCYGDRIEIHSFIYSWAGRKLLWRTVVLSTSPDDLCISGLVAFYGKLVYCQYWQWYKLNHCGWGRDTQCWNIWDIYTLTPTYSLRRVPHYYYTRGRLLQPTVFLAFSPIVAHYKCNKMWEDIIVHTGKGKPRPSLVHINLNDNICIYILIFIYTHGYDWQLLSLRWVALSWVHRHVQSRIETLFELKYDERHFDNKFFTDFQLTYGWAIQTDGIRRRKEGEISIYK